MQVGMRIKVFCTVVQGDPPFLFTWLKDGVPVVENGAPSSQAAINVHNERDYSMLSTDSLQLEHSGNYTCVVKNQAATTAYSAVLRVNEPPKWDVEPESAAVVQGRNVQLQCSASGTPRPIITWMIASDSTREEFLPLYNSHKYGLFPNGTLSIHQLEPEESGYYLCKASNGFGEDLSKLVFLTVKRSQWPPQSRFLFDNGCNLCVAPLLEFVLPRARAARTDPPGDASIGSLEGPSLNANGN